MGKADITGNEGEGLYTADLNVNSNKITNEITALTAQIADLTAQILDLELDYAELYADKPAADDLPGLRTWSRTLANLQNQIDKKELSKTSFNQRLDYLSYGIDITATDDQQIWCADYSLDLTGEHATIEVIREWEKGLNIRPGYDNRSVYDTDRDGQLEYPIVNTPTATYYNFAIWPGAQRWLPIYRYAVLTSINKSDDTCSLLFESMDSGAGSQFIMENYNGLSLVPIEYMECNSAPFEIGDDVIVESPSHDFTWTDAKVIGYKDHPQPCDMTLWWIRQKDPVTPYAIYDYIHVAWQAAGVVDTTVLPEPGGQLFLTGPDRVGAGELWMGTNETEYVITPMTILKMFALPSDITTAIAAMLNIKYATEAFFDIALISVLGAADAATYGGLIKKQAYSPFSNSSMENKGHAFQLSDNKIVPGMKIEIRKNSVSEAETYYYTANITGGTVVALNTRTAGQETCPSTRYIVEVQGQNMMCASSDRVQYKIGDWVFLAHPRNQNHSGGNPDREDTIRSDIKTQLLEKINDLRSGANPVTFPSYADFPAEGVDAAVYLALDTEIKYTWSGTAYKQLEYGQPYIADGLLNASSQRHAEDQQANLFVGHTGSDGSSVQDRITDAGYLRSDMIESYSISAIDPSSDDMAEDWIPEGWLWGIAENAAWARSVEEVLQIWIASSEGHFEMLIDPRGVSLGIGIARYYSAVPFEIDDEGSPVTLPAGVWYSWVINSGHTDMWTQQSKTPTTWLYDYGVSHPNTWITPANAVTYPELARYTYREANFVPVAFPVILPLKIGLDQAVTDTATYSTIDYAMDELKELIDTVILNAKIMRIHREVLVADPSATIYADIKTEEYGISTYIENVPFHYHCEDGLVANGHKAFKVYDEVLVLVKDARDTDTPIADLEKYIVGFSDGFSRTAQGSLLVIRSFFNEPRYPGSSIPLYEWVTPDTFDTGDMCTVWDLKNGQVYDDCYLWNAGTQEYDTLITFPHPYQDFYENSDFNVRHVLQSDMPVKGFLAQTNCERLDGEDNGRNRFIYYDYPQWISRYYFLGEPGRYIFYRPLCKAMEFQATCWRWGSGLQISSCNGYSTSPGYVQPPIDPDLEFGDLYDTLYSIGFRRSWMALVNDPDTTVMVGGWWGFLKYLFPVSQWIDFYYESRTSGAVMVQGASNIIVVNCAEASELVGKCAGDANYTRLVSGYYPEIHPSDRASIWTAGTLTNGADLVTAIKGMLDAYWNQPAGSRNDLLDKVCGSYLYD